MLNPHGTSQLLTRLFSCLLQILVLLKWITLSV